MHGAYDVLPHYSNQNSRKVHRMPKDPKPNCDSKNTNLFSRIKSFRRISTRYEKLHSSFSSMLSLACILLWLKY